MTPRAPFLLAVVTLLSRVHGQAAANLDQLLGLSELPLKNLLHVKRTFVDFPQEEVPGSSDADLVSGEEGTSPSDGSDLSSPEALALMGAGGGHSRRKSPLTYKRMKTPLRRGGGSLYGVDLHGKGKGKKGSISNIFQTSVTALSFLAFGGYLLCLIVQAIRAKKSGTAMMNGAALHANLSRFVFLNRRPTPGKRRKRDSRDEEAKAERLNGKIPEGAASRGPKDRSVSGTSATQQGYKREAGPRAAEEMESVGSEVETITELEEKVGSDDKQEFSAGPDKSASNQTKVDGGTAETSDDHVSEDPDTAEKVRQADAYREDVAQLGLWPMANVDDMYSALLMIAEGYSQYHQKFHTG